jgi:uncharacterized membrane protein YkvA (DUF1232 family)
MPQQLQDKSIQHAKRRFFMSLVFLIAGIMYAISPVDLIPDVLAPIGWVDDLGVLFGTFLFSWLSYRKMKKQVANNQ